MHRMDIDPALITSAQSVPMALGKHLFSFRTQKLSPAAAIILRKRETSTVPNYTKAIPNGVAFVLPKDNSSECFRS